MRLAALSTVFGSCVALAAPASAMGPVPSATVRAAAPATTLVEYYCSPGFAPSYGGRCVATPSRDEIDLYLNDSRDEVAAPPRAYHRYRHRHHRVHARY